MHGFHFSKTNIIRQVGNPEGILHYTRRVRKEPPRTHRRNYEKTKKKYWKIADISETNGFSHNQKGTDFLDALVD